MSARTRHLPEYDIARGIGIFLSVLGHSFISELRAVSAFSRSSYDFIYFFHMGLFFFISGALAQHKESTNNKRAAIKKRFYSLMVPYLTFSAAGYAAVIFLGKKTPLSAVIEILTTENHIFHHLWFLYIMFFVSVFVMFLGERSKKAAMAASAILFVVISAIPAAPLVLLYLCRYLFFYLAGMFYVSSGEDLKEEFPLLLIGFLICDLVYVFFFAAVPDVSGTASLVNRFFCCVLLLFGGTAGCISIIELSKLIAEAWDGTYLSMFGQHSMEIYLFHMPVLVPVVGKVLYHGDVPAIVVITVTLAAGLVVPLYLGIIMDRVKILNFLLLGKR